MKVLTLAVWRSLKINGSTKKCCSCPYDQTDRMVRGFRSSRLQQVSLWRRFGMTGLWAMGMFAGGVLRRRRRWIDGALNTGWNKAACFPRTSRGNRQNELSHCHWFLPGLRSLQQIVREGTGYDKRYCSHRF
jgi:hypothetical protein